MINGVLLLVFPCLNAQTLGTWITACFHLPSWNRGKFAYVCLNCAGLWLRVVWAFPDSPNTTGWPPVVFQGLAPMDQLSKSRTKTNLQAKYRTPRMPLAARRWFSEGSKSRSQKTWQCVQVMFKAKKHIYKKHGFSKFDHTTMRKKTHQNELDGWKHDGWALASG